MAHKGGPVQTLDDITLQCQLREYDTLRQEILMLLKLRYEILTVTITLVGGLLGYGLTTNSPRLYMLPLVLLLVLFASATMTYFQTRHSERISAYISASIETHVDGLRWQRSVVAHKQLFRPWSYSKPLALTYGILGVLPLFLFFSLGGHACLLPHQCELAAKARALSFLIASLCYFWLVWKYFHPGQRGVPMQEQWHKAFKLRDKTLHR
jgi:hypothetical protein